MSALEPGAVVGYTASFVRNIGGALYGVAERRGTVEAVEGDLATIRWHDEPDRPQRARVSNLAVPGSARFGDPHA